MSAPIITLKNASVIYHQGENEIRAMDSISLEIYPEEYVIFFGPSGCGKSTVLYTIAGLQNATSGEITVLGHNVSKSTMQESVELHRFGVGMVFQAYYLIQSLSVLANVALPQTFIGASPVKRNARSEELLKRFDILNQANKFPNELSGGQQQRVAVARSLVNDPPIILADEPVGNLDSKSAEDVLKLFQELNEHDKKTIVLVTHNPNHLGYASRIFYMEDGKVVREVRNEERKQVREEVVRPLAPQWLNEFAKQFPNVSDAILKAKMIVSYLLEEIDVNVRDRVEHLILGYFKGQINDNAFTKKISQPLREGGIGFYRSFADRFANELHGIMSMAAYLKSSFGLYPRDYESYRMILERLSSYLLLSTSLHLTEDQRSRFYHALQARLEGSLTKQDFEEVLDRGIPYGGVGLNIRTAQNITRHLELLLVEYPAEHSKKENQASVTQIKSMFHPAPDVPPLPEFKNITT